MSAVTQEEKRAGGLAALAERVSAESAGQSLVRVGGTVTHVTPASCCVAGLSPFVKIGDRVTLATGDRPQLGEVIRLDESRVTIKTFDEPVAAGLGASAWRIGPGSINPDPSWKGHVVDALGTPLTSGAPFLRGA